MHTCVHKKIPRHMKLRAHTSDTANSPGKSAFSGSLQRKRDASFAHCQGHNGWRLACRMHVYAGGSDHMLYQRINVLNPGITASCSSVQPSFLAFIVVIEECTFPHFGYKQKSNHRTPTNQVLESRGKDLKTLFKFFSPRKDSNPRNRTSFCTSSLSCVPSR